MVARILETMGYPVYYSDVRAREIMNTSDEVKVHLIALFGREAINAEGIPDRRYLSQRVFSDPDIRQKLNELVHPLVRHDYLTWEKQHLRKQLLFRESALLPEAGMIDSTDKLLLVTAPLEVKIKRVMMRDGRSRDAIIAIINSQVSDEAKLAQADFVLINDDVNPLLPQILKITAALEHEG